MKKLVSVLLTCSLVFGLAGCKSEDSKKSEERETRETKTRSERTEETSEEEEETTEATLETVIETTEETTAATERVQHSPHGVPTPVINGEAGGVTCGLTSFNATNGSPWHYPVFNYPNCSGVNSEIQRLITEYNEYGVYRSNYFIYTYENLVSVVWTIESEWESNDCFTWTVDTTTGNPLSNAEIFAASNCVESSITEVANNATVTFVNDFYDWDNGVPLIVDGGFNTSHSVYAWLGDHAQEFYDITFSSSNLNDNMKVGIDSDGCLVFISEIFSVGGAASYVKCYNDDGASLEEFLRF